MLLNRFKYMVSHIDKLNNQLVVVLSHLCSSLSHSIGFIGVSRVVISRSDERFGEILIASEIYQNIYIEVEARRWQ